MNGNPERVALRELVPLAPANGIIKFSAPPDPLFFDGWTPAGVDGTLTSGDARFAFRLGDEKIYEHNKIEIHFFGYVPRDKLRYELYHGRRWLISGTLIPSESEATAIVAEQ